MLCMFMFCLLTRSCIDYISVMLDAGKSPECVLCYVGEGYVMVDKCE